MADNEHNNQRKNPSGSGSGRLLFVAGVLALVILFLLGYVPRLRHNRTLTEEAKAAGSALPEVPTLTPHPAPDSDLALPGTMQAIADAVVGARTTGYVRKRYVDIGAHVRAGQVLAEIESPDVDQQLYQAQAQVAQSQAGVEQARADVANKQATVAQSQSNVQQAEANLETARAQIANAQARQAQLEAAESASEAQVEQAKHVVEIKQAALGQAKTQRDLAAITLKRYQSLLQQGFVALQDVDQNQANYNNALAAVESAQSDVNSAQASVVAAQQNVRSNQANVESGKAEVRAAEKTASAVAATVRAARSTVRAAQASVNQSRSNVQANQLATRANSFNSKRFAVLTSFERVKAPFDGVITARNVDVGTLVNSGSGSAASSSPTATTSSNGSVANVGSATTSAATPNTTPGGGLFGLARTEVLRILVSVPQSFVRQIHPGLRADILLPEYPGRTFAGTVARVSGALDVTSRTLLTEVHVDNRDGALLPGMYAQVHFNLPHAQNALRVAASTVMYDAQGTRVATITKENKVHFVPVKVGSDFGAELEITEGLRGNETLAASPGDDLAEGESVKPVAAPPPPAAPAGPGGQNGPGGPKADH